LVIEKFCNSFSFIQTNSGKKKVPMFLQKRAVDRYPAINKPAAILHWLSHVQSDAEYIVILDADMLLRGSITPWEFGAKRGLAVSAPYE